MPGFGSANSVPDDEGDELESEVVIVELVRDFFEEDEIEEKRDLLVFSNGKSCSFASLQNFTFVHSHLGEEMIHDSPERIQILIGYI